jgi:ATP-dependent exoDNAse (exonuclease V) beta subunit
MPPKNSPVLAAPPDQDQRDIALDPMRSVIVQAPAGSGKTDLLTRRFLRLLAEVDEPGQIVAITFTRAAAAEMRHRILAELEKAAEKPTDAGVDESSMEALAARALARSRERNWQLPELAAQLRISTIDSFCRDLAIQEPIFSRIGNRLDIHERPAELYRMAARTTLGKLGDAAYPELSNAIQELLLWRDNGWKELEELLVKMLGQRDRWMHDFVLSSEKDWEELRGRLERPFARAVRPVLDELSQLLDRSAREEAHQLARFSCEQKERDSYRELAELAEFPHGPYENSAALEEGRIAYLCVANLVLNNDGEFRAKIDKTLGFPKEHLDEKFRMQQLIVQLRGLPGLDAALAAVRDLPPARYSEEDWRIIRASFTLLRQAAGELKTVFAESGTVDFIEVAQIARSLLKGEDQFPSDAAIRIADNIHHLLVDEFQDTSRRQHEFVISLIEAWPDPAGRTIFVVGDPMQSIYFFRDAEAELFHRARERGFELGGGDAFSLDLARLSSNFRTDPELVARLNQTFEAVFAEDDGSGIQFAETEPARNPDPIPGTRLQLHVNFMPEARSGNSSNPNVSRAREEIAEQREAAQAASIGEIVDLIRSYSDRVDAARAKGQKYRIAVLGRARSALTPIAAALREAEISFRAVELETLKDRPEILDAVALARAVFSAQDRVAWLGVLRAPWCGFTVAELHAIAGADGASHPLTPVLQLLRERMEQLSAESRKAAERVAAAFDMVPHMRAMLPNASVGTLIQQVWRALGGDRCIDDAARANLDLFWRLLDRLPGGEQDLLSPALDAALEDLCAVPDPETSSECGVQLMTIHKSKGLEFEVVIVPELQANNGGNNTELLSWLERGLLDPGEDGELTEFLIAPVQFKGRDPGKAKQWVKRIRDSREAQEMRRIFYVAATRAREELHLFARPTYKRKRDGTRALADPAKCLLATAWPAFGDEIRARFDEWNGAAEEHDAGGPELVVESIAAEGNDNIMVFPRATLLRRLPGDFEAQSPALDVKSSATITGLGDPNAYRRHEGGQLSRALGNAVHRLLEELARLRRTRDWAESRVQLGQFRPRIVAMVRATGIAPSHAEKIASEAVECAIGASRDPQGQWVLSPHADAASESGWAGVVGGSLHHVRVDRIFQAGLAAMQTGNDAVWIIDYKTAQSNSAEPASALPALRAAFAPQLNLYAAVLRNLHGPGKPIRAGLYYPRMLLFDWWEI